MLSNVFPHRRILAVLFCLAWLVTTGLTPVVLDLPAVVWAEEDEDYEEEAEDPPVILDFQVVAIGQGIWEVSGQVDTVGNQQGLEVTIDGVLSGSVETDIDGYFWLMEQIPTPGPTDSCWATAVDEWGQTSQEVAHYFN